MEPAAWHQQHGTSRMAPAAWHQLHGNSRMAPAAWHQHMSTRPLNKGASTATRACACYGIEHWQCPVFRCKLFA
eukprot:364651-Chlamydomonas_euryale.AAC.1